MNTEISSFFTGNLSRYLPATKSAHKPMVTQSLAFGTIPWR